MFQVTQFDPQATTETSKDKRKRREPSSTLEVSSSLRVIAPEQEADRNVRGKPGQEEAFDDMDIVEGGDISGSLPAGSEITGDNGLLSREEIQSAIDIAKMPLQKVAEAWKLAPFLLNNLKREGFASFFPIQALTIPDVIANERHPHIQARDVCITAPTGSGKTLSYVLPILNSLATRQFRKLRALVVLPSRDLADQVYRVFQMYTEGSNLKVGLAVGQSDFKAEQLALTVDPDSTTPASMRRRLQYDPGNLQLALKAFRTTADFEAADHDERIASPIDILVCTPGRLVDHLESTISFTLEHLRFICIDEADRLLNQSYHNWFDRVLASAHADINRQQDVLRMRPDGSGYDIDPFTLRRVDGHDSGDAVGGPGSLRASRSSYSQTVQLRKFLVSATLTRDPQKLASLHLVNPRHFDLHQLESGAGNNRENKKYSMPSGLEEYTVECTAEQKPVVLLSLILEGLDEARDLKGNDSVMSKGIIVVFTSSLESTHRLTRLLQLLWVASRLGDAKMIAEFSSSLNQKERAILIQRCKDGGDNLSVVVCSDGMSRGMDIDLVSTVVNYDVPSFAKVYVHRCGRTARAGKKGMSITLLKGGQIAQFRRMRSLIHSPGSVGEKGIKKQLIGNVVPHYRECVQALKQLLEAETDGKLSLTETDALSKFLKEEDMTDDDEVSIDST